MVRINSLQEIRCAYLDWGKGLGIFLIMLGHVNTLDNPLTIWGSSFKIIIFYIISGYLFAIKNSNEQLTVSQYVLKKLKSFGIPYVVFSALALILDVLYGACTGKSVVFVLFKDIYAIISLKGISTLWFIPTLFIAEVAYFCIDKYCCGKVERWLCVLVGVVAIGALSFINNYLLVRDDLNVVLNLILWPLNVLEKSIIALGFFAFSVKFSERIFNNHKQSIIILGGGVL